MSRICEICGKGHQVGNTVSHAHNKSKKVSQPNLQRVHVRLENGEMKHVRVCTSCIRSGRIQKAG